MERSPAARWSYLTLFAVLVSGCAEAPTPANAPVTSHIAGDPSAADPSALGTIEGVVRTSDLLPISGVKVALLGPKPFAVTTNAAGEFRFESLEPGAYQVAFERLGYEGLFRGATVEAGGVARLDVVLKEIFVATSYSRSFVDQGYIACHVYTNCSAAMVNSAPDKVSFPHPVDQELVAGVATLVWQRTSSFSPTFMSLNFHSGTYGSKGYFWNWTRGDSPLTLRAIVDSPEEVKGTATTYFYVTNCLVEQTSPYCAGSPPLAILTLDQRFAGYTTQFYGDFPPADFTGLPK